jgi:predicted RNA binding protein YcfA (HicA-like mRNA interferase family)
MSLRNKSSDTVIKILTKYYGFEIARQKGSHVSLINKELGKVVVVPRHDTIKEPTLKSILYQAGLTKDDFLKYL